MAEWLKAAVLKTVERKFRGFESYFLRHIFDITLAGEMTELAEGARLLSECGGYTPPRVRIPLSPPFFIRPGFDAGLFHFLAICGFCNSQMFLCCLFFQKKSFYKNP